MDFWRMYCEKLYFHNYPGGKVVFLPVFTNGTVPRQFTQKKDSIESKKIICLKDFI